MFVATHHKFQHCSLFQTQQYIYKLIIFMTSKKRTFGTPVPRQNTTAEGKISDSILSVLDLTDLHEVGVEPSGACIERMLGVLESRPDHISYLQTTYYVTKSSTMKVVQSPLCSTIPTTLLWRSWDSNGK
jgi:hypothetical protein